MLLRFDTLDRYNETVSQNLQRPFALAGRRAFLCGTMDGAFPDMGQHLPGEMGGLWTPPLKLADGFWFGLSEGAEENWQWLYRDNCRSFTMQPGRASRTFDFARPTGSLEATEEIWLPHSEPALFVSLTLTNPTAQPCQVKLAWLVRFELRGAWWTDWPDRPDVADYDPATGTITAHDSLQTEWAAVMRGDQKPTDFKIGPEVWAAERTGSLKGTDTHIEGILRNPAELQGEGISGQLVYEIELAPASNQTLHFVIAGHSQAGSTDLPMWAGHLLARRQELLADKLTRLEGLMDATPRLDAPAANYARVFDGSALCLDLMTLNLPKIGPAITAGLPGFAWFFGCDTYYTLSGLLVSGQSETALANLRLLADYARRQNGRIPHEIIQNGEMFNPGNAVEAAEYVISVERAFRWTGDRAFLNEVYDVCRAAIFDYLLGECDPQGDLLPDGPGLLELRSAERGKKLDVASCLYQALGSLEYLARVMADEATANRSQALARAVADRIERYFWLPARAEYVWRIEDDLTTQPDEPAHSYAVLEMGVVHDLARATALFAQVEGPVHTGPKGLIHPGTTDFVMPIQNEIMALAEFRYHRPDEGLRYLQFCADLYGYYMPWAIPEFVGSTACFVQAWSSAAFNWLVVQGCFRLEPDPLRRVIQVQPQLPSEWPYLQVNKMSLWGVLYDLRLERQPDGVIKFEATSHNPDVATFSFEVVQQTELPANFV